MGALGAAGAGALGVLGTIDKVRKIAGAGGSGKGAPALPARKSVAASPGVSITSGVGSSMGSMGTKKAYAPKMQWGQ
jgi:hypothetical protein